MSQAPAGQPPIRRAVIVASTRDGRLGETVAGWFTRQLARRTDFDVDVIDLRAVDLPPVQSSAHPKSGRRAERQARLVRVLWRALRGIVMAMTTPVSVT